MQEITRLCTFLAVWLFVMLVDASQVLVSGAEYRIAKTIDVDTVPSAFPVGFCLLTHGQQQLAAYYNAGHQMVVARRKLGETIWQKVELPSKIGWDSHNYITMAVDSAGAVHLAGNMHCVPLIYFRTRIPGDITTFERLPMIGKDETRCTYPRFLNDREGNLLFSYRAGRSGNGRRFFNRYGRQTETWIRFLNTPLFDGQGRRNAYPIGPKRGPDGRFHVIWVWRDTPDCATNHGLSYARSRDLKTWTNAAGVTARLPLTLDQSILCVDPVPTGGGIINGCEKLAFDAKDRPVIAYHKRDSKNLMQIYVARFEHGRWICRPVTRWDKVIDFSGGGAMPFIGINIGDFRRVQTGVLGIRFRHRDYGTGWIFLDESTLQPVPRTVAVPSIYPRTLSRPSSDLPGMHVRLATDSGSLAGSSTEYLLRWETLAANHDRRPKGALPPPSTLQLVKLIR